MKWMIKKLIQFANWVNLQMLLDGQESPEEFLKNCKEVRKLEKESKQ